MDPVEIETNITLSRTAGGDIPFGVAVQRIAKDVVGVYGAGTNPLATGTEVWTASAGITATNPTPGEGVDAAVAVKLAVSGAQTGLLAYTNTPTANLNLGSDLYFGVLIKSSTAQIAGNIRVGVDEGAAMATTPQWSDLPALPAGEWVYAQVPITGNPLARDTANSIGIDRVASTGAMDIWVQKIDTATFIAYDIAGIAKNDEARDENIAKEYDTLTVLATGHINPVVVDSFVCIAEQPVYFVPGTGKVTTTKITTNTNVRIGYATEDQATAGKQTGVRF